MKFIRDRLETSLTQVRGVPVVRLSALTGRGIDSLMPAFVFKWAVGAAVNSQDVSEWAYATLVVGPLWLPRPGTSKAVAQLNRLLAQMRAAPDFEEVATK